LTVATVHIPILNMARPSKTAAIVYTQAHDLTDGLLDRATCPAERPFVLLKDACAFASPRPVASIGSSKRA